MDQDDFPFYESAEQATDAAIQKFKVDAYENGKRVSPYKVVATAMCPDKKHDTAYAYLKSALDPGKTEKLSGDQHIFIANFTQQFDFIYYCCQESHHGRPPRITLEAEKLEVDRRTETLLMELKPLLERRLAFRKVGT